jgi:hypothetical protein
MPGALPTVFGEAGEAISNKVDDIVNSRKFLADIDPNTGSNTVNKANAQAAGDSVITGGLPRTVTRGFSQPALLDAALFASGMPPVATMVSKIPLIGRKLAQPSKATRAEVARTLMQRPAPGGPAPAPPDPITPMTGRNRPRKWRKDEKWKDPNLTNPQIEGAPAAKNGFFPEGNTFPMVAAGYGAANPQDVPGTSEGITWEDRVAYAALLGGGAKALGKIDNLRPPPGGPPAASNGLRGASGPTPAAAVAASQGKPGIRSLSRETKNFDRAKLIMEDDFVPADANPEGPLAFGTRLLRETPQGKGRKATLDDWEFQLTENRDTADDLFEEVYAGNRAHLWNDEPHEYLNAGGARVRIAQLRQQGLDTSDLEKQLRQRDYDYMRRATAAYNDLAEKEGFAPKPEIFPKWNKETGAINIGGGPQRRKDLLKEAMSKSQGAPVEGVPQPSRRADPTLQAPYAEGPPGGPLPWLAGIGAAGMAGTYAYDQMTQPRAVDVPARPPQVPQTFGPSVKPDLSGAQKASAERANMDARTRDQAERQEYWQYLKSRGDDSPVVWNQIHQKRASELRVTPQDRARGVSRKRLPYVYGDTPVSVLSEAPIEELIDGHWRPVEPSRAVVR